MSLVPEKTTLNETTTRMSVGRNFGASIPLILETFSAQAVSRACREATLTGFVTALREKLNNSDEKQHGFGW
jgi:hypothetical protein